MLVKTIYRKTIKYWCALLYECLFEEKGIKYIRRLVRKIISYHKNNPLYKESIEVLRRKGFQSVPFFWTEEYNENDIQIFYDKNDNLPFVYHECINIGKQKLFFPSEFSKSEIKRVYNALLIEQDKRCTHAYFSENFYLDKGVHFFDIGCAEANLSLQYIDYIDKLYLFECDKKWMLPLKKTFEPWLEKITIVNKYVSDKNDGEYITMNTFLDTLNLPKDTNIYIKADIEGFEKNLIRGGGEF